MPWNDTIHSYELHLLKYLDIFDPDRKPSISNPDKHTVTYEFIEQ